MFHSPPMPLRFTGPGRLSNIANICRVDYSLEAEAMAAYCAPSGTDRRNLSTKFIRSNIKILGQPFAGLWFLKQAICPICDTIGLLMQSLPVETAFGFWPKQWTDRLRPRSLHEHLLAHLTRHLTASPPSPVGSTSRPSFRTGSLRFTESSR
jgi:hypothetical protein